MLWCVRLHALMQVLNQVVHIHVFREVGHFGARPPSECKLTERVILSGVSEHF